MSPFAELQVLKKYYQFGVWLTIKTLRTQTKGI